MTQPLGELNQYHHVVYVKNGASERGFFDGVLYGANEDVWHTDQATGLLRFGQSGADVYKGRLDDVRIYNRAFSTADIEALYEYERAPTPRRARANGTITNGVLVDVGVTDGGTGYTNSPNVTVLGGGGTGAKAKRPSAVVGP